MIQTVSRTRKNRENGSALVEFALTFIPLFAMLFGFFDIGLMQFRWLTLQNAVREGVRYAITFQTQSGMGQDASIKAVVEQYGMGFARASDSPATITVQYFSPTALSTPVPSGGNIPGNVVMVNVSVAFSWFAPLSGSTAPGQAFYSSGPMTLRSSAGDVLGGYPVGVTSVAE